MNYEFRKATTNDLETLIKYKLNIIFEYATNLSDKDIEEINKYAQEEVANKFAKYKLIEVNGNLVGALLMDTYEDGLLLDELYLENEYRGMGIGTDIIKTILYENAIVYLWVYKLNTKAINLYKRLGFEIVDETESRYFMKRH